MNTAGIVQVPKPVLRAVCEPVAFDDDTEELVESLLSACWETGRAGVAAPQIGLPIQAFAARLGASEIPQVFLNPTLTIDDTSVTSVEREGCLSIKDRWYEVERWESVGLTWATPHGEITSATFQGYDARILQHEYDHLSGTLIIDRTLEWARKQSRQVQRMVEREVGKVTS